MNPVVPDVVVCAKVNPAAPLFRLVTERAPEYLSMVAVQVVWFPAPKAPFFVAYY